MFQRIRSTASWLASPVTGLLGSTASALETAIFGMLSQNNLRGDLFKPLGYVAGSATLLAVANGEGSIPVRLVKALPVVAIEAAIFAYEGPVAAGIFTVAMVGNEILLLADCYAKHKEGKPYMADLLIKTGKQAAIVLTLTYGGIGKVLELAKIGELSLTHKISSIASSAFSALESGYGLFRSVTGLCSSSESKGDDLKQKLIEAKTASDMDAMERGQAQGQGQTSALSAVASTPDTTPVTTTSAVAPPSPR